MILASPVRRRLRALLILVLILLLPVAAHQLWDYVELRRLVAEIEKVVGRGEPVRDFDVTGFESGPGTNTAGKFYIAAALAASDQPGTHGSPAFNVEAWLTGWKPEPSVDDVQRLRNLVASSPESLALADRAAALEFRRLPPGTEYSYRTSHLYALSALLSARTVSLSLEGRGDDAVAAGMSSIRFRRALKVAPFQPLGFAEVSAIVSLSRPSVESLEKLQAALESEEKRDRMRDELLVARAALIESLWRRHYGPDPAAPSDYRLPMRSLAETVQRPLTSRRAVRTLREWARLVDAANRPWPERIELAAARRVGQEGPGASFRMSPPAVSMTVRAIVMDRCAITILAIARFRRDHGGSLPDSLDELTPRYLSAVPADPFTGRPLFYARDDVSFTVYSAGADKKDHGGDLSAELQPEEKRLYGPRQLRGRDVGLRVIRKS